MRATFLAVLLTIAVCAHASESSASKRVRRQPEPTGLIKSFACSTHIRNRYVTYCGHKRPVDTPQWFISLGSDDYSGGTHIVFGFVIYGRHR
jgi:hypothetical protein